MSFRFADEFLSHGKVLIVLAISESFAFGKVVSTFFEHRII
jgi:hypothetical protein